MALNADGKPMVGIVYHTKVKKYALAQRRKKTLVRKSFLETLTEAVRRVVVEAVEATEGKQLRVLQVKLPKKTTKQRLVVNTQIKALVAETNADLMVMKCFFDDLNTYVAALIVSSMKLVEGAYLEGLVTGDATAKVVDEQPAPTADNEEPAPPPKRHFEPALPRDHVEVDYRLTVQNAVLEGKSVRFFTAKTTASIEGALQKQVERTLHLLGISDPATVEVLSVRRGKKR